MAEVFLLKPIRPAKLREAAIWFELKAEIEAISRDIAKDFQKTVSYWHHKPKWDIIIDEFSLLVGTDDEIYGYVNYGTSVRYAAMSRGFASKTVPGILGSSRGRGKMMYINPNFPRPGIEAREFDKKIAKIWEPKFKMRMEKALHRGVRASGHSI